MWYEVVTILVGFSLVLAVGLKLFERRMYSLVDSVGDIFSEVIGEPTISKAFGILGKKSADSRAESRAVDQLASDVLNGPQFAALKAGAGMLGIDIDGYIEEHGAIGTLTALQQISGTLGIDVNQILQGGASGLQTQTGSGEINPYL